MICGLCQAGIHCFDPGQCDCQHRVPAEYVEAGNGLAVNVHSPLSPDPIPTTKVFAAIERIENRVRTTIAQFHYALADGQAIACPFTLPTHQKANDQQQYELVIILGEPK